MNPLPENSDLIINIKKGDDDFDINMD